MGTALKSLPEVLLFRAFARDLANKIRCMLKSMNPLIAGKNSSKCRVASCKSTNEIGG
jgi:hypothetical protein